MGKKLGKYLELTNLKQGTTRDELKNMVATGILGNVRALVVNYQDLGLLASFKAYREASERPLRVVIANFPWMLRSNWFLTLKELKNDWDEVDVLINPAIYLKKGLARKKAILKFVHPLVNDLAKGKQVKLIVETVWLRQYCGEDWKSIVKFIVLVCQKYSIIFKTNSGIYTHTFEDLVEEVTLARSYSPLVIIKAAGGIKTLEQARTIIKAGANTLGSSSGDLAKIGNQVEIN
jgi:deoxyribose-phosphate aldolase